MATNIFHRIQELAVASRAKFKSFFKQTLDDEGVLSGPKNETSADHHDPAEEEDAAVLDLEAGLQFQHQRQEAAADQVGPQKGQVLLPVVSIRPSVLPSSPSHSSPISNVHVDNSSQSQPQPQGGLNAVAQVFRERELGIVMMGFLMPLTAVFVSAKAPDCWLLKTLVVSLLSIGFAAILIGILLRNTSPRYANKIEPTGAACIVFAIYAIMTSLLPPYFQWLPLGCFVLIILVVGRAILSAETKLRES